MASRRTSKYEFFCFSDVNLKLIIDPLAPPMDPPLLRNDNGTDIDVAYSRPISSFLIAKHDAVSVG